MYRFLRSNSGWFFLPALLLAFVTSTAAPPGPAAPQHNVVVIMVDDLSENMMADLLGADLMPQFRQHLGDSGLRFADSFVTNALCCPSRATFLTGTYSHNHQVLTNDPPRGGVTALDDASTLATWLADAGYVTGFVGKYLNGYGANGSGSSLKDDPTYVPPGWTDWQALTDPTVYRAYDYQINDNGLLVQYGMAPADYQTDVLTQRSVEFLTELPGPPGSIDAPFFLWVSPRAPHVEHLPATCSLPDQPIGISRPAPRHRGLAAAIPLPRPPSFDEADRTDKPHRLQDQLPTPYDQAAIDCMERSYRSRLESMVAVDGLIGALFAVLTARNALDSTVVMFTSDNGFPFGEHRFAGKIVPYEESIRVPLYIRHPRMTSGSSTPELALDNDLAPTVADLAGVTPGLVVDGRSLVPLLEGTPPGRWRTLFLIEGYRNSKEGLIIPAFSALRFGRFAPVPNQIIGSWQSGDSEYYNLSLDPYQLVNRYDALTPEVRQWATERGNQLKACAGQACRDLEEW